MAADLSKKLIVGISSRALFNLEESNEIFEHEGIDAYTQYQIANENNQLEPGEAFYFVKKLLNLHHPQTKEPLVEVILLSRNNADTGLRIFNSIQHFGLNITRAAFTNGESPYKYIHSFGAHLFLSANANDVQAALRANCAAATLLTSKTHYDNQTQQVRIAFDGDAVLFSDEAEVVYQTQGLSAFKLHEVSAAKTPLEGGPFKGFLNALHQLQKYFSPDDCPIRTALVTARDAPAHERVVHTLRTWNIRIDEALFLGGLKKSEFLKGFGADIFFDDQKGHCDLASEHVATGHVPHGITNQE